MAQSSVWLMTTLKLFVLGLGWINLLFISDDIRSFLSSSRAYTLLEYVVLIATSSVLITGLRAVWEDDSQRELIAGGLLLAYRGIKEAFRRFDGRRFPLPQFLDENASGLFGLGCVICGWVVQNRVADTFFSLHID